MFWIGQNSREVRKNMVAMEIEMHSRARGAKHLSAAQCAAGQATEPLMKREVQWLFSVIPRAY